VETIADSPQRVDTGRESIWCSALRFLTDR